LVGAETSEVSGSGAVTRAARPRLERGRCAAARAAGHGGRPGGRTAAASCWSGPA